LAVGPDRHEAGVTKYAELFRNGRLAQGHATHELPDGLLALTERVEDESSSRCGEDFERRIDGHGDT
jgi:hypothetical protein